MAPLVTAIREPQRGGSQAFVSDLARGLAGRDHDVHVYAASGSEIPGVEVIDTGVDPGSLAGTLYRAFGPSPGEPGEAEPAAAAVSAALRQAAQGGRPPAVATVSAIQASAWRRVTGVDAVLPPYPPTGAIPWSGTAGTGALFAGRLSPEKGAAEAIDIARAAGEPIDVYGDPYDPGYSREQIDPRRDWPGVTLHRGVPRATLWEAMARAAVVLCPSRWDEPFGLAAAEAQACGTPVVAFRRGGLSEVIVDGVTGF